MSNEDVKDMFRERAKDQTITCAECLELARELEFPSNKIVTMLSEMGIKIVHCQLGCFP